MSGAEPAWAILSRVLAWLAVLALLVLMPPVEPAGASIEICTADGIARVAVDPSAPEQKPGGKIHCQLCLAGRVVPILPFLPQVPVASAVFVADLPLPREVARPSEPVRTPSCRGPPQIA